MGILGAFTKVGGSIFRKGAQHDLERAQRRTREGITVRNIQKRRAFIKRSRVAIAENLVQGAALGGGGGLDSSAFQGAQASLQTQTEFAKQLDAQERIRQRKIARDQDRAEADLQRAQGFEQFGEFADSIIELAG